MIIEIPDGYNGHTIKVDSEPIEEYAGAVRLRVVTPGREYMVCWRHKEEIIKAVLSEEKRIARQKRANDGRKARNQAMRDLGLVRVRGALGGVYWE